jgi:hypothetical protein
MAASSIEIRSKENELDFVVVDDARYPPVIKDLFVSLSTDVEKNRWSAKCKICLLSVTDVHKTTSNFLKHVKNKHAVIFTDWKTKQSQPTIDKNQPMITDILDKKSDKCEYPCQNRANLITSIIVNKKMDSIRLWLRKNKNCIIF